MRVLGLSRRRERRGREADSDAWENGRREEAATGSLTLFFVGLINPWLIRAS